jgi:hypothetical protein
MDEILNFAISLLMHQKALRKRLEREKVRLWELLFGMQVGWLDGTHV